MKKSLTIILIVVVFALVGVGGVFAYQKYSVSKTQNQTAQPSITITSPNGGETWVQGSTHNITWTSANIASANQVNVYVAITDYSPLSNFSTMMIADNIPITRGQYSWAMPSTYRLGSMYKISVYTDLQMIVDSSDNYFSIVTPIDQTVGWKTYTNTQYGFEIKYPKDFTVSEQLTGNGSNVVIGFSNQSNVSMEISADSPAVASASNESNLVSINGFTFTHSGGLYPNGMNVYSEYYKIIKSNTKYSIHIGQDLSFGDALQKDVIATMTKITQSFKFTK
ncbi:MAG: hypothetical protein A2541_01655 [Candidatus Taylorbacteria bacterium RIFOXYD2_FULL_36_9]|uniref:Uncharacterized protein n=1 Tax=Candidatus Taylorbacteria bacterium RIFOXYD2_FULL_36_9 TaxID=1802338 RepID=A0A1G2PH53_9BACT|nr:MAG: hypothetical protein A2541_01655 [Candidatus Taylorbacteria bacterium RIFOXYD2_FULL_36_9]